MSEGNAAAAPTPQVHTRESLFPEGWDKQPAPEQAEMEGSETAEDEASPPTDEPEDLAPQQETDEEQADVEESPEATDENWQMTAGQFTNQAGISLHELNHNITFNENGKQKTISEIRNEAQAIRESHDAMLRERSELQEKVQQLSAQPPQMGVSPEVNALMAQAQIYEQALATTDWSKMEPGLAASQKVDLSQAIAQLKGQAQAKHLEHQQAMQQKFMEAKAEADRQTRAQIPEWANSQVYETEWRQIGDMLHTYGISQAEADNIADPRVRRLLRDHVKLRGEKQRITEGAKKVRKVSKTLGAAARTAEKPVPTLKDAKQRLAEARRKGASREELSRLRVTMPIR